MSKIKHPMLVMDSSVVKKEYQTFLISSRTDFVICYDTPDQLFDYKLFYPEKSNLEDLILFLAFANWWSHDSSVLHETAQELRKIIIRRIRTLESQS